MKGTKPKTSAVYIYKNGWYKQKNAWQNGVDDSNNE